MSTLPAMETDAMPDPPNGSRPLPTPRKAAWFAAYVVATLLLVRSIISFVETVTGDPEDVVHDYLTAVHDGDVDTALEYAAYEPSKDEPLDAFLGGETLRQDWDLGSVSTRHQSADSAIVDAAISGPDGREKGVFRLSADDDTVWSIDNPFVKLSVTRSPVWENGIREQNNLNINGTTVTVPAHDQDSESDAASELIQVALFPGVYGFFAEGEELVKPLDPGRTFLPAGAVDAFEPYTPRLELTEKGGKIAEKLMDGFLADCAAQTKQEPQGCPFGVEGGLEYGSEYVELSEKTKVTWTLPEQFDWYFADSRAGSFTAIDRNPTTVTLNFEDDGRKIEADCDIFVESMHLGISSKGDAVVEGPSGLPSVALDGSCPS
ncbi:MAG: hypothetical protein ACRD0P_10070 [Stackebrandtia sp.]